MERLTKITQICLSACLSGTGRGESLHRHCSATSSPYSLLHSPHSSLDPDSCCKSCIRCTATTEPWLAPWALGRTWDRTGGLQVHRHAHTNKCVSITHFFSCWLTAVTHLHHCRGGRKLLLELKALTESNLAAKRVFKHKWQSVRAVLFSVWREANKMTVCGTETHWGKRRRKTICPLLSLSNVRPLWEFYKRFYMCQHRPVPVGVFNWLL